MNNWVYIYSKSGGCHTVGFHDPDGDWIPESDHDTAELAAARVNYLNGGKQPSESIKNDIIKFSEDNDNQMMSLGLLKVGSEKGDKAEVIIQHVIADTLLRFHGIPLEKRRLPLQGLQKPRKRPV